MASESRIPELAGVATYADAARIGYSVDENVSRLVRYQWIERRLMYTLLAHLPATPEWEVKCAMALHQWYFAQHVDALRTRIGEMRHPVPPLESAPQTALDTVVEELLHSADTVELLTGVYVVLLPALSRAYRTHMLETNPLIDHPTRRQIRLALIDVEEMIAWGEKALNALGVDDEQSRARRWQEHLSEYLRAAGGISGTEPAIADEAPAEPLPAARATKPYRPNFTPARDNRFSGSYNFNFPPHIVYNTAGIPADERNLALLCKRTLEMDVPEMMASFMVERSDQPWDFHFGYSRQLWDEARHAMMGTVAFEARGIDWTRIPLNVGFSLRLNLHADPLERQTMLFAIEQSLMPGDTGKRSEYETALEAGDLLSAHFHDYDWADEVLHAHIGRRMLKRDGITPGDAARLAQEIHERTWKALERYLDRQPQAEWWPEFVRRALGHESATNHVPLGELKILAE